MINSILYSIIVPSYNRGHLLPNAIESIFEQAYEAIEIIVIDDGSTDNTKEIVEQYGSKIIYQYQPNQGSSAARNLGIKIATGKYISFLDSDDIFLPGKMKREQESFRKFPDAEVIVTDSEFYENDIKLGASWMKYKGLNIEGKEARYMDDSNLNWIQGSKFATCNFTMHRSVIQKLGNNLFDISLKRGQDWDLEIRIICFCKLLVDPYLTCQVRRIKRDKPKGDWKVRGSEANIKYQKAIILDKKIFTNALNIDAWTPSTKHLVNKRLAELDAELLRYAPTELSE